MAVTYTIALLLQGRKDIHHVIKEAYSEAEKYLDASHLAEFRKYEITDSKEPTLHALELDEPKAIG